MWTKRLKIEDIKVIYEPCNKTLDELIKEFKKLSPFYFAEPILRLNLKNYDSPDILCSSFYGYLDNN